MLTRKIRSTTNGGQLIALLICVAISCFAAVDSAQPDDGAQLKVSSRDARQINRGLARLAYNVDQNSDEIDEDSAAALSRVLTRLGSGRSDLNIPKLAAMLGRVKTPSDLPCPKNEPQRGDVSVPVTIRFWGDRPEDYLADFYLRLAVCNPALLNPVAAPPDFNAKRLRDDTGALPSFPVYRTQYSNQAFIKVMATLARSLPDGPSAGSFGVIPGLSVDKVSKPLLKTYTKLTDEAKRDNQFQNGLDKPTALTPDDIDRICAELGYAANCYRNEELLPKFEFYKDRTIIEVFASHFELNLTIDLPKSAIDVVLADALDFVRAYHPEMQGRSGKFMPWIVGYPSQSALADVGKCVPVVGKDPKTWCNPIDMSEHDKRGQDVANAVGWINLNTETTIIEDRNNLSRGSLAPPRTIKVGIADPGFEELTNLTSLATTLVQQQSDARTRQCKVQVSCQSHNNPQRICWGDWCALDAIVDADRQNGVAMVFNDNEPPSEEKDLGHGYHVGSLVRGSTLWSNWQGFAGANTVVRFVPSGVFVGLMNDTVSSVPPAAGVLDYEIVNNSYEAHASDGSCPVSTNDTAIMSVSRAAELQLTSAKFNVVAAPYNCNRGPALLGSKAYKCNDSQTLTLACAGAYLGAIAVAPLIGQGDNWSVLPPTDGRQPYFLMTEVPWLGAPGRDILAADIEEWPAESASRPIPSNGVVVKKGYRLRSGSSMSAPIVTALVARVRSRFLLKDLKPGSLKNWIFANATPTNLTYDNNQSVFGMVNFARTLLGTPNSVNVWIADPSRQGCSFVKRSGALQPGDDANGNVVCNQQRLEHYHHIQVASGLWQQLNLTGPGQTLDYSGDEEDAPPARRLLAVVMSPGQSDPVALIESRKACSRNDYLKPCYTIKKTVIPSTTSRGCNLIGSGTPCLIGVDATGNKKTPLTFGVSSARISHIVSVEPDSWVKLGEDQ